MSPGEIRQSLEQIIFVDHVVRGSASIFCSCGWWVNSVSYTEDQRSARKHLYRQVWMVMSSALAQPEIHEAVDSLLCEVVACRNRSDNRNDHVT